MSDTKYSNLGGVHGGKLNGRKASSISGIMRALKFTRVCSAAGDYGTVAVWRDDIGHWRCEFCRNRITITETTVKTKSLVHEWLKTYFPKCHTTDGPHE